MTHRNQLLRYATNCIIAATLIASAVLAMLPHEQVHRLNAEGGIIENLSAAAAALCVLLAVFKWIRAPSQLWLAISLAALWMFLRELDYQKIFTPRSIESIGFYSAPHIPLLMKLLAIAALSPFVVAIAYLAWNGFTALQGQRFPLPNWCRPLVIAAAFLAAALASEKLLPPTWGRLEELLELSFLSLILLIIAAATLPFGSPAKPYGALAEAKVNESLPLNSDHTPARHLDLH